MNVKERLIQMFKDYKGESIEIDENATFDELGFDSLDKVEFLMKIEEEFGIEFEDDLDIKNTAQLVEKIEKFLAK